MHDFYIYLVSLLFIAVVNPYFLYQIHNFLKLFLCILLYGSLFNSYTMGTSGLPDVYTEAREPQARGQGCIVTQ